MLASAARLLALGAAPLAVLLATACNRKSEGPAPVASQAQALPPVDEPPGLGATLFVRDGGATWQHARGLAGDALGLAPASIGGAVALATGLPIGVSDLFSEHDPVVGALLEPTLLTPTRGVVAFHLRAADRLIALSTQGQSAGFVARRDEASNADFLEPIATSSALANHGAALGVFGNYLVVGTDNEALRALGPYATRNLAEEPAPKEPAVVQLRPGLLKLASPFLRARVASIGGGPAQMLEKLAVSDLIDRAADSTGGEISIDLEDDGAAVTCSFARGTAAAGAMECRGPVHDILALPSSAHVGMVAFEPTAKRQAEEESIDSAVAGFLEPADRTAFDAAFGALTQARGDGFALGFENGLLGQAFYGRVAIADREVARKALGALVDIAGKESVKSAFAKHDIALTAQETVIEHVGDVVRVRVGALDAKTAASSAPGVVNLLARMNGQSLTLGSGADANAALRLMIDGPRLESDKSVEALIGRLPEEACSAVIVDPARILHGATAPRSWMAGAVVEQPSATDTTVVLDAAGARALLDAALR